MRKAKVAKCTACKKTKPRREFATRTDTGKKRKQCRACKSAQRRRQYLRRTEQARRDSWKAQGIDVEDAVARLTSHNGLCELCGRDTPRGMGDWHVDHAHGSPKVRGILCFPCNIFLGKVERLGLGKITDYLSSA